MRVKRHTNVYIVVNASDSLRISVNKSLKIHVKAVHLGEKPHGCTVCGKFFAQDQKLKVHMQSVHLGEKKHDCKVCNKSFSHAKTYESSA